MISKPDFRIGGDCATLRFILQAPDIRFFKDKIVMFFKYLHPLLAGMLLAHGANLRPKPTLRGRRA